MKNQTSELSLEEKRERLKRALIKRTASSARTKLPPIEPRTNRLMSQLSFAQRRLWLIDQIDGPSSKYNIAAVFHLDGDLNLRAMEHSLSAIIERHEVLRSVYRPVDNGDIAQFLLPHEAVQLPLTDISDLPEIERSATLSQLITKEANLTFNLSQDRMLRAQIIRLAVSEHLLLVTMHHIASDGWSIPILVNELNNHYTSFAAGHRSNLLPLKIQYSDFADWQANHTGKQLLERQLEYWREQLVDLPAVHNLPLDRPRKAVFRSPSRKVTHRIEQSIVDRLTSIAQEENATLFMVLSAVFTCLMYRYSGDKDIVFGSPVANREASGTEGIVGFFVNTLVIRTQLEGDPNFHSLLCTIRETLLEAYEHQQVPFEQLVDTLKPDRSLSYTPLFQIMLALQNNVTGEFSLPGLKLTPFDEAPSNNIAKYDLTVNMVEGKDGLIIHWEYAVDLFDAETITRMSEHFGRMVESVVHSPSTPISHLPYLTKTEIAEAVDNPCVNDKEYDVDAPLARLFESQSAIHPGAIAVRMGATALTYGELNKKANRLARMLQLQGVTNGDLIGLCMYRSYELITAMLAILKAGAAYVPLDPSYPEERLHTMIEVGHLTLVIATRDTVNVIGNSSCKVLELEAFEDLDHLCEEDLTDSETTSTPNDLAYVCFTSGSTGLPKGVMTEQRSVASLVKSGAFIPLSKATKSLQISSISFDAATFEIWAPLLNGGELILYPEDIFDLKCMNSEIERHGVNTIFLTASLFEHWSRALPPSTSLKFLLAGGDIVNFDAVHRVYKHFPEIQIYNGYGPTETTTFCSCYPFPRNGKFERGAPIGARPPRSSTSYSCSTPHANLIVLDEKQQIVPQGVIGELYVAGNGLTRGYIGQAELSREKLIEIALTSPKKQKLYRTGDFVRWQNNGTLEFVGRKDYQVKVRGFRIELPEIEQALRCDPDVQDAVVTVQDEKNHLEAYLLFAPSTGSNDNAAIGKSVRNRLRKTLPDYMIPAVLHVVDSFPLNKNGKVDRGRLATLDTPRRLGATHEAPETPAQATLATIWGEVLGHQEIGIREAFFDIGGNSLTATKMVAKVREYFGVDLPLRAVFEHQTIDELSGIIEQSESQALDKVVATGGSNNWPLSYSQNRLWLIDKISPGSIQYNMPIAMEMVGSLSVPALNYALNQILSRHQILRTTYHDLPEKGVRQIVQKAQPVPLEIHDFSIYEKKTRRQKLKSVAADEAMKPFHLDRDLMLRAELVRLESDHHVLLVNMHHIASDGWSISVLTNELGILYRDFITGNSSLKPLELQYPDYAVWQRKRLQGEYLAKKLDFWKRTLEGTPPLHQLPLDFPRPAASSFKGANFYQKINTVKLAKLQALANAHSTTLFMLLQTAFACLIARYSGEEDVVIGSPIANREQNELAPLVGFFVNTLALRTRLDGNPLFSELLTRNRAHILEAYEHQQVPFEMLVEELKLERSLSHNPLFQIMFSLQNNEQQELSLGDLTLDYIQPEWPIAKFDLNLTASETQDGLALVWEYATDLFMEDSIRRMADCFAVLLDSILTTPNIPISELPLLSEKAKGNYFEIVSGYRDDTVEPICLHKFVELHAANKPNSIAVVFGDDHLTYGELELRANRIAHCLIARGVIPDDRVGLLLERSLDMVAGILAIWKVGAAYVPYDTDYTDAIIAERIRATAPCQVVASTATLRHLQEVPAVVLDKDNFGGYPDTAPEVTVTPDNLAYVLSTSGSTGEPKMIGMSHRPLVNLLRTMHWDAPALGSPMTTLQFASIGFDMSFTDIGLALLHGGRVVMIDSATRLNLDRLVELICRQSVTVMNLPYSLLQALTTEVLERDLFLEQVKVILSTAEQLKITPQIRTFFKRHQHIQLINHYGPSETHVCTTHLLSGQSKTWPELPSIGRPIANIDAHVLDAHLKPVPIGVVGELHIGGVGLSRGYLSRDDLTAKTFLTDPFNTNNKTAKLYKTGDRVRYRADGTLEYLGRLDTQVKLRGFRIELGAIETALSGHSAVRDNCVLVDENSQQLVSFVVSKKESGLEMTLRQHLKSLLPDYMIPTAIVLLDDLPLNSSGKVDRKKLSQYELSDLLNTGYVKPETDTEIRLCNLWQKLLGRDCIGVKDNFFAIGGHSLLATRLITEAQSIWAIDLSIKSAFDYQTVRDLAQFIDEENRLNQLTQNTDIRTRGEETWEI
ncbi:non-ribosomal peptide synthetase [Microbulbifer sp. GL-2]|uniref:non-ribosomal peptide synthetase n=1 Tax=Microbulbifer sp. GL-2 TaxID=2591606 RepID=UPI0011625758|nr:non-ribosomal peptide synthetase [Microbulbifer sp. GL-2]BBM00787.1 hypothetical protein GL2_08610 [Microbulbifer sp. GL-2]